MMENWGTKGIPYEIPAHIAYAGKPPVKSEKRKSKYFDLQRDTEVGLHLGSMEEMEKEYIEQVCSGVPWKHEAGVSC
ncbi:MAG: hypothetical protein K2O03_06270 [Lachnospiraceae bacterium]|nr:hypothetical protein [Lachnospiraceae bacterium]